MFRSFRTRRTHPALFALLCAALLCAALAGSASALAGPTVTVHVEGTAQTLLAPTEVTTDSTPVVKDSEHSCSGTSAAGALQLATGGSWSGEWFEGFGYSVEAILGEAHLFEPGAPANYFWSYWLDDKPSSVGICEGELHSGESMLFFPECFSEVSACPAAPNPLGVSVPALAERGAPVAVTVTSYANADGTPSPAAGATVAGGGADAVTDASGHAAIALAQTGEVQLHVTAPDSVRTEATVCVHAGNDGNCGTSGPAGGGASVPGTSPAPSVYKGPYAIVARTTGPLDNHVYRHGHGPHVLGGTIVTHAPVASVSLKLRRSFHGRCFAYDGVGERFERARCGHGSFFAVGSSPSYSYLLPAALAPGRYVLDVEATDTAGNHTTLARGSSRIVFYVASARGRSRR